MQSMFLFKNVYFYFNGKVRKDREREREAKSFHLLVHSSNVHNSRCWTKPKPGNRSSTWVTHKDSGVPAIHKQELNCVPSSWRSSTLQHLSDLEIDTNSDIHS